MIVARDINVNTSGDEDASVSRSPQRDGEGRNASASPSSEQHQTLSSPLKALDISPDVLKQASGRYSKIMKLALIKSIDKYKEIRNRLEDVERQVNLMLNQAYTGAKGELNKAVLPGGPPVEQKVMKGLIVGVKRILEEKVIANENIKTHDMRLQRLDSDGAAVQNRALGDSE